MEGSINFEYHHPTILTLKHTLLLPTQVKSRDHEFENIPHLVHYFMEHQLPLVIGNSTVHLYKPVINAFPSS